MNHRCSPQKIGISLLITQITGRLKTLTETGAALEVGAFEYEVYLPEFVRRQLQSKVGEDVVLRTIEYLEGNPQQGRLTPRLVGFTDDVEREFFDLVCSVDGVGVKKALRAMVRPVRDVATAIEEQDIRQLSTLPGVGPAVAERIIAKLRRKMAKFALMVARDVPHADAPDHDLINDAYEALISVGHSPTEARQKIESVCTSGKKPATVEQILIAVYEQERGTE